LTPLRSAVYGERVAQTTFRNPTWDFAQSVWPNLQPTDGDRTTWSYYEHSGFQWEKTDAAGQFVERTYKGCGKPLSVAWARGVTISYAYNNADELLATTYSDNTPGVTHTLTRMGQLATVGDVTGTRTFNYEAPTPWRLSAEDMSAYFGERRLTALYESTVGAGPVVGAKQTYTVTGRAAGFELGVPADSDRDLRQEHYADMAGWTVALRTRQGAEPAQDFAYGYVAHTVPGNGYISGTRPLVSGYATGASFSVANSYASRRNLRASTEAKWGGTALARYDYTYDVMDRRRTEKQSGTAYADYTAGQPYGGLFQVFAYNPRSELETAAHYRGDFPTTAPAAGDELPGRRFEYRYDQIGNRRTAGPTGNAASVDEEYTANALNQYTAKENNTVRILGTASTQANLAVAGVAAVARRDRAYAADFVPDNSSGPAQGSLGIRAAVPGAGTGGADAVKTETRAWSVAAGLQALSYDADGNLTGDGVWTYTWDAENRLTAMQTAAAAVAVGFAHRRLEFVYDYLHRRVGKKVFAWDAGQGAWTVAAERRFIHDGWNVVAELDGLNGGIVRSYTWGLDIAGSLTAAGGVGALLRIVDHAAGKTLLPVCDARGIVTAVVNNVSGALEAIYEYSPFGEVLRAEGAYAKENPFRFSTKYTDDETGLVYHNRRYYAPELGRFLGRDPIEESGGLNLFAYVANNAINRWDHLGMSPSGTPKAGDVHYEYEMEDGITYLLTWTAQGSGNEGDEPYWGDEPDSREPMTTVMMDPFSAGSDDVGISGISVGGSAFVYSGSQSDSGFASGGAPNKPDVDCAKLKQQLAIARSVGEKALSRVAQNGGEGSLLDVLSTIENTNALSGLSAGLLAYGQQLRLDINNTTINSRYGPLTRYTNVRPSTVQSINHAGAAFGLLGMGIDSYQAGTAALNGDWSGAVSNGASAGLNGTIILIAGSNPITAAAAGGGALVIGVSEQAAYAYLERRDRRWNEQHLRNDQRLATDAASKVAGLEAQIARDCP
jgi:RHS repeat-associated protein